MKTTLLFTKTLFLLLAFASFASAQDCAAELRKLGNAPGGGFLMIKFDKSLRPAACGVKGTTDKQNLRGNSGVWTSGKKYTSAAQTIVMYDAQGNQLGECAYDESGNLMVTTCFAEYADAPVITDQGQSIDISWFMTREEQVVHYEITRSDDGGLTFIAIAQVAFTGSGVYSYEDTTTNSSALFQIQAVCTNGNRFSSPIVEYSPRR